MSFTSDSKNLQEIQQDVKMHLEKFVLEDMLV